MAAGFAPWGPDHLGALAATVAVAAWFVLRQRRAPSPLLLRGLAVLILLAQAVDPLIAGSVGRLNVRQSLPLELCDLASFAAALALWTRRQGPFEFAWFWGLSGTLMALLTPTVNRGFPHPEYFRFFVLHAGIVVAVLGLGAGLSMRPRRGAVWRVYGWTAVYACAVGLVDWALSANYFYLREKPPGSVLEPFGAWPWYIGAGALIGAALFFLLDLPFAGRGRGATDPAPS